MWKQLAILIKSIQFTKILFAIARAVLPLLGLSGFLGVLANWFGLPILEHEVQKAEDQVDSDLGKYIDKSNIQDGVTDIEKNKDQTQLETAIGSENAGKPAEDREGVRTRDPIN